MNTQLYIELLEKERDDLLEKNSWLDSELTHMSELYRNASRLIKELKPFKHEVDRMREQVKEQGELLTAYGKDLEKYVNGMLAIRKNSSKLGLTKKEVDKILCLFPKSIVQ